MRSPRLSIAIPAYNEASVIADTVDRLADALMATAWSFEIVVADDGSTDATWTILIDLAHRRDYLRPVRNAGPGGYGMAVKRALQATTGEAIIIVMADGSDQPADVVAYARVLLADGFDCAFGTRFPRFRRPKDYPPLKFLLNRLGNRVISMITRNPYNDFTNGFKGYRREVIESMQPLISADFNLTIEMSMKAVLSGYRYHVRPNDWHERTGGVSKFDIHTAGMHYLLTILYCLLHAYLARAGARPRRLSACSDEPPQQAG